MATAAELTKQSDDMECGNVVSRDFTLASKDDNLFERISALATRLGGRAELEHPYGEDDLRISIHGWFSDEDYTNGNMQKFEEGMKTAAGA
jgi:hypothetical protein